MMGRCAVALLLVLGLVAGAQAAGSDDEVSRRLFAEILAPVDAAAQSISAGGIAVRGAPATAGPEQRFFNAVGDAFLEQGYDVWILQANETVPSGVLALDLELSASEIDYPRQSRQLLGFGRARILRRVSLGARMRLTDPGEGRVLYDAEPVRVAEDWMSFSEANRSAEVRPDWMGAIPVSEMEPRNPWWQRALVVGIVGGVAVLYFSGAT